LPPFQCPKDANCNNFIININFVSHSFFRDNLKYILPCHGHGLRNIAVGFLAALTDLLYQIGDAVPATFFMVGFFSAVHRQRAN
jgi:hypothetical protein